MLAETIFSSKGKLYTINGACTGRKHKNTICAWAYAAQPGRVQAWGCHQVSLLQLSDRGVAHVLLASTRNPSSPQHVLPGCHVRWHHCLGFGQKFGCCLHDARKPHLHWCIPGHKGYVAIWLPTAVYSAHPVQASLTPVYHLIFWATTWPPHSTERNCCSVQPGPYGCISLKAAEFSRRGRGLPVVVLETLRVGTAAGFKQVLQLQRNRQRDNGGRTVRTHSHSGWHILPW